MGNIQIRYGCFETNSSSAHSIAINKNKNDYGTLDYSEFMDPDCKIRIPLNEDEITFGRAPFRVLCTPKEKLLYVLATFNGYSEKEDKVKEIEELVKKHNPEFECFIYPKDRYDGTAFYGDVNTCDFCVERAIENCGLSIEELIMNNRYFIIVDGDEYMIFNDLVEGEFVDKDSIEYLTGYLAE